MGGVGSAGSRPVTPPALPSHKSYVVWNDNWILAASRVGTGPYVVFDRIRKQ